LFIQSIKMLIHLSSKCLFLRCRYSFFVQNKSILSLWYTVRRFYVVARNALGPSEKASQANDGTPAVCQTPQTAPERNPQDVCTRLGRPHQLVIVWKVGDALHCNSGFMAGGRGEIIMSLLPKFELSKKLLENLYHVGEFSSKNTKICGRKPRFLEKQFRGKYYIEHLQFRLSGICGCLLEFCRKFAAVC